MGAVSRHAAPTRSGHRHEWEYETQVRIVTEFSVRHPKFADLLIHPANGGSRRNAFEGWRLKRMGVRAGVSDLFLAVPRGGWHGLWIEVKAEAPHTAVISEDQKSWLARMRLMGYRAEVCVGSEAAAALLDSYLASGATIDTEGENALDRH